MEKLRKNIHWPAVAVSIGALILGFVAIWVARAILGSVEGPVMIALILLPWIVYLSASGRLSEFKGPGGIEAKFAQTAADTVKPASETIGYNDPQVIAKEGMRTLVERKAKEIDESKPIVMTMIVGGGILYSQVDVEQYLRVLTQFRNFKFVVFLDPRGRFVAYISSWSLKQLLQEPDLGFDFIQAVNAGETGRLLRYPGVVAKPTTTNATNAEALQQMLEQNIDALVVIDAERGLRGVVEREQVLSRMMLALVR